MKVKSFCITCSGASPEVLKKCPPSEHRKHELIGVFVFLTALAAWGTAGYGIYTSCENISLAAIVGLLWALIIFNLDRYIVSNVPLEKSDDGNLNLRPGAFILRLMLGCSIGIIISTPLELYMFRAKIDKGIQDKLEVDLKDKETLFETSFQDKVKQLRQDLLQADDHEKVRIDGLEKRALEGADDRFNAIADEARRALDQIDESIAKEQDGMEKELDPDRATVRPHPGPIYRAHENRYKQLVITRRQVEDNFDKKTSRLKKDLEDRRLPYRKMQEEWQQRSQQRQENLDEKIHAYEQEKSLARDRFKDKYPRDFTARLSMLWELQNSDETLSTIAKAITLLLIFIEALPITVKALGGIGCYELVCYEDKFTYENAVLRKTVGLQSQLERYLVELDGEKLAHKTAWESIHTLFQEKANDVITAWKASFDAKPFADNLNKKFSEIMSPALAKNDAAAIKLSKNSVFNQIEMWLVESLRRNSAKIFSIPFVFAYAYINYKITASDVFALSGISNLSQNIVYVFLLPVVFATLVVVVGFLVMRFLRRSNERGVFYPNIS